MYMTFKSENVKNSRGCILEVSTKILKKMGLKTWIEFV
jgi:hypothetical protein